MASTFITRCPKCNTSFKVSAKQLQVAKGAVRCGACLHVFKAMDNLVPQPSEAKASASKTSASNTSTVKASAKQTEEPVRAASKTRSTAKPAIATQAKREVELETASALAIEETKEPAPRQQVLEESLSAINDDEDEWLISDDMDTPDESTEDENPFSLDSDRLAASDSLEIDERFLSLDTTEGSLPFAEAIDEPPAVAATKAVENADESWAEALLEDVDDEDEVKAEFINTIRATEPEPEPVDEKPETQESFLGQLEPEPLEIALPPKSSKLRSLAWAFLCSLAAVTLAAQYIYFNFTELAREPQWRPYLKESCRYLDCRLPSMVTPERIKTNKLLVRSHPSVKNALIVDALFTNSANYSQPFPVIELTFSSQNNQITASREFLPAEYLKGEMAGMELMPSKTPVHISLAIKDPGKGSENYRLRYLPNYR